MKNMALAVLRQLQAQGYQVDYQIKETLGARKPAKAPDKLSPSQRGYGSGPVSLDAKETTTCK